uniref:low-density lipoprotein receptor-related protein 12-like isoform X2 n=1 Tax=Myxine glutinosa TaxID=7769 RepID=UPI0035902B26
MGGLGRGCCFVALLCGVLSEHRRELSGTTFEQGGFPRQLFRAYSSSFPWACGSYQSELHGPLGTIRSPSFPAVFLEGLNCSWLIKANAGEVVTISFEFLKMEKSPGCSLSWLVIGSSPRGPPEYRVCGKVLPRPFISHGDRAWVKFHSNFSMFTSHFALTYVTGKLGMERCDQDFFRCNNGKCIPSRWLCNEMDECGDASDEAICTEGSLQIPGGLFHNEQEKENAPCINKRLRNFYGWFSSPSYPRGYPGGSQCRWLIDTGDTRRIVLLFVDLQLVPREGDSVRVYDDSSEKESALTAEFTAFRRYKLPLELHTHSGHALVVLNSGEQLGMARGFNVSYHVDGYCPPGQKPCGAGDCYDDAQRCDWHWDCPDGRDEAGCGQCPRNHFPCSKTNPTSVSSPVRCYSLADRCNYQSQCADGTDERHCLVCQPGTWHCRSHRCIFESWVCDGQDDCGDGSDEQDCPVIVPRRVITAATIGGLICGLLLVIALGCSCKLYTLRSRHYQWFENPLTQLDAELLCRDPPPSYSQLIAQGLVPPVEDFPVHTHSQASVLESLRLAMRSQLGLSAGGTAHRSGRQQSRVWRRLCRLLRVPGRGHGGSTSGNSGDEAGDGVNCSRTGCPGEDHIIGHECPGNDSDESEETSSHPGDERVENGGGAVAGTLPQKAPLLSFVEAPAVRPIGLLQVNEVHLEVVENVQHCASLRENRTGSTAGRDSPGLSSLSNVARSLRTRLAIPRSSPSPQRGCSTGTAQVASSSAASSSTSSSSSSSSSSSNIPLLIALEDCPSPTQNADDTVEEAKDPAGNNSWRHNFELGQVARGQDWGGARPRISPEVARERVVRQDGGCESSDDDSLLSC